MRFILIIQPRDGETAISIPSSQQRERKTSSDSFNWKPLILNRYKWYDYYSYWFTAGICLTSWTLGSSLVATGLTAGQAIGAVCLGGALATMNAFFCGEAGRQHFLGYTMMGRATWGLYGSYLCIALSCVQSIIYVSSLPTFLVQSNER
jgi:cytosine/uracil/thiamine/allantoin permease